MLHIRRNGDRLWGGRPVWVLGWVKHIGQGALDPPLCVNPSPARGKRVFFLVKISNPEV
jgi:hypothetical protein